MKGRRILARIFMIVIAALATSGVSAVLSSPAFASQTYQAVGNGLALHNAVSLAASTVVTRVNNGAPLVVVCQVQNGPSVGGNRTWDRLDNGLWVTDYFTTSPSWNSYAPGLADCSARVVLGGLDLKAYCNYKHPSIIDGPSKVVNSTPFTAYTWSCLWVSGWILGINPTGGLPSRVDNWQGAGMDMNDACWYTYVLFSFGTVSNVRAELRDTSPSGWYCTGIRSLCRIISLRSGERCATGRSTRGPWSPAVPKSGAAIPSEEEVSVS